MLTAATGSKNENGQKTKLARNKAAPDIGRTMLQIYYIAGQAGAASSADTRADG
jgi:hypothetical protein